MPAQMNRGGVDDEDAFLDEEDNHNRQTRAKERKVDKDPYHQQYHKYHDPCNVKEAMRDQRVMSAMYDNNTGQFYCRVQVDAENNKSMPTNMSSKHRFVRVSLSFELFNTTLDENLFSLECEQGDTKDFDKTVEGDVCILLPMHDQVFMVCAHSMRKATDQAVLRSIVGTNI